MEHSCCSLCKSLVASVRNSNEFKQKGDLLTLVSEKYRAFLALGMGSSRAYAMSLGLFLSPCLNPAFLSSGFYYQALFSIYRRKVITAAISRILVSLKLMVYLVLYSILMSNAREDFYTQLGHFAFSELVMVACGLVHSKVLRLVMCSTLECKGGYTVIGTPTRSTWIVGGLVPQRNNQMRLPMNRKKMLERQISYKCTMRSLSGHQTSHQKFK